MLVANILCISSEISTCRLREAPPASLNDFSFDVFRIKNRQEREMKPTRRESRQAKRHRALTTKNHPRALRLRLDSTSLSLLRLFCSEIPRSFRVTWPLAVAADGFCIFPTSDWSWSCVPHKDLSQVTTMNGFGGRDT